MHEELTETINPAEWVKDLNSRIIAVAVDGSDHGDRAYYWCLQNLIKSTDASVLKPKLIFLTCRSQHSDEVARVEALALLRSYASLTKTAGINVPTRIVLLKGEVKREISDFVDTNHVDVLVLGSRGLTNIKRALLGSTSDYVSKHCACTIVIAK
ncbi:adenine nucleotide alpha hydrolases-like protein [Rhizoclosmatium globosum]|uniref:Adenine nucleotide alpha hydrolases-like protein n=1 Tax=Rhizoclosmatium globosum TaxID=329046 RepID=A0A1Y2CYC0_9FUNG|nr:adenine nucleotide alpha hydrolases-like protein [Rhizoclosmatium globosum]|eukprot:ORY52042.1 adenine nucleotide alpha hydrolases-like protein [Rhizoclosmatium globosum]